MIYLDNAATTGKKPPQVINAVNLALKNYSANPGRSGHKLAEESALLVYKARKKVGDFFGCNTENVVFTSNCTLALNMAIKGNIRQGDHIIISSYEHNAVLRPVYKLALDGVAEFSVANVTVGDGDATYRAFERLIKPNTKMIVCTHASNVTGEIMPILRLSELCKEKGIIFVVDAAQTAGILPIDMKGIDYLCVAAHKGLYAPMGTGILLCGKESQDTLIEGGTGTFSNMFEQPKDMPERLESGTVSVPLIAGVKAGVDFIEEKGLKKIHSHEITLLQTLYDKLASLKNVILYTKRPKTEEFAPVLSFNLEGKNSMEVAEILSQNGIAVRAGLHCSPLAHKTLATDKIGTVRVCPSVYNTKNDCFSLINVVKSIK
ncbi:MAG: aminotransferase class V-fold PLP-dependent enzyme [Clostridia bacterium]|nr:aminotransferase class V-fold PLP-dependent enzyme [Clostridia bacterium]